MRLKHLQLLGYKTFATKTEFLFPSGITAIIGPNGSGKSNIADALRWVLGEQSYVALRGKRTEDMIFSGSQSRARAGMAEVVLTLDNSDGWLPLDYSEITVSRRAFRDSQNEYRINNSRVRYRDVSELLSHGGLGRRNYTIVGQGLVDAVLSLRARERRELFEEAAGISHYRDKRADALQKLDETHRNLERVHDIMSEIEPRVRRLKRQADRTMEHDELSEHLQKLLRVWYGYRWGEGIVALEDAQTASSQQTQQYEARSQALQALTDEIDEVRKNQADLRRQLGEWHRENSTLHRKAEESQRELAVLEERKRQFEIQREGNLRETAKLNTRIAVNSERVQGEKNHLKRFDNELVQCDSEMRQAQAALNAHLIERQQLEDTHNRVRDELAALGARVAEQQSRSNSLRERIDHVHGQIETGRSELIRLDQELTEGKGQRARVEVQLRRLALEIDREQEDMEALGSRRLAVEHRLDEEQGNLLELREAEADIEARCDLLGKMRGDFSLYGEAARTLLKNAKGPETGIRGVLAQMVQVPEKSKDLAPAIEAALGAYSSAVIVDTWETAQNALRVLRSEAVSGRVILLAIEPSAQRGGGAPVRRSGEWTPLSSHIACEEWLRPLIERLLGDAYLTPDLETARSAIRQLPQGAFCVTRDGQVLRNDWSIEGGGVSQQASPLSQEREWLALNARRIDIGAQRESHSTAVAATSADLDTIQNLFSETAAKIEEIRAKQATAKTVFEKLTGQINRLDDEIAWRKSQIAEDVANQEEIEQREKELTKEITALQESRVAAEARGVETGKLLSALATDRFRETLASAQMALATSRQAQQSQQAILAELESSLAQLETEKAAREAQTEELASGEIAIAARSCEIETAQTSVSAELLHINGQIAPAEERLEALATDQKEIESRERLERARLREFENRYAAARLEVQRSEEHLSQLRRRIEEDLGLVELELGPKLSGQTPLPLHPLVSRLPTIGQIPDGLEEEISRLRAQIRRLGPVNPNAPEEYKEASERYDFLHEQSSDLVEASESLHKIIGEMDGLIEHAFRQTFDAVAREFSATFRTLFGGGQARLELSDPDNLTQTGVDIIAQPPGKRLQALASLSGGERALTAVALIFSVLKVSPTPFCILDEVDAMLDEANVERFRALLESLSEFTQIVIITHNRGTVLSADTVYGVSMGADSASQVYSIRLDGEKIRDT